MQRGVQCGVGTVCLILATEKCPQCMWVCILHQLKRNSDSNSGHTTFDLTNITIIIIIIFIDISTEFPNLPTRPIRMPKMNGIIITEFLSIVRCSPVIPTINTLLWFMPFGVFFLLLLWFYARSDAGWVIGVRVPVMCNVVKLLCDPVKL